MGEVIAAVGVLFSISIFVAHALDAYRTRCRVWTVPFCRVPIPAPFGWRI